MKKLIYLLALLSTHVWAAPPMRPILDKPLPPDSSYPQFVYKNLNCPYSQAYGKIALRQEVTSGSINFAPCPNTGVVSIAVTIDAPKDNDTLVVHIGQQRVLVEKGTPTKYVIESIPGQQNAFEFNYKP